MESVLRTSTLPVVCLLVVHYVAETQGGAACDSPYINNGRPVNIPEEEYAKYCCKAKYYDSFTTTSRFDCASEGGCCGEVDKQYCCDQDKVALQLGLGIGAGAIVLLVIIAVIVCCCLKSAGYTCNDCCKDRDKPLDLTWNNGTRTNFALDNTWGDCRNTREGVYRTTRQVANENTRPSASISFHRERDTDPVSTIVMSPTAPPAYVPDVPPDAPPPSYTEVIRNPHVFPSTDKGNGI
ncbi:uncharacterized protein LOC124258667 isoform X3 [Haliotis rubra]|uniref:uncharacterized protein LOC124258667 isoform X3 n=1 Tax=Haliotis rubra TaxID=36100 RepID=UPI001EE546E8|nr:uncharacterized protein LOC124258667 isoform X3 [Haliotis rubra]